MTQYVIYSEEDGVYLGSFLGLGFWSKLGPNGQDAAVVFESIQDAQNYIRLWPEESRNKQFQFVPVEASLEVWATIEDCVKAGLPAWVE